MLAELQVHLTAELAISKADRVGVWARRDSSDLCVSAGKEGHECLSHSAAFHLHLCFPYSQWRETGRAVHLCLPRGGRNYAPKMSDSTCFVCKHFLSEEL